MTTRYEQLFARLRARREGAFVPFVVVGDPTPEASLEIIDALVRAGADALELGLPYSDPVADGPTIQAANLRALEGGTRRADVFRVLAELREQHPEIPVGLLVYANLVEAHGVRGFYAEAAAAGVDSVLVADVPTLEAPPYAEAAHAEGVLPVLIATATASEAHLAQIAALSAGITYVVSRAGVTGTERRPDAVRRPLLEALARLGAPPPLVGFGISRPEHVRAALDAGAAGAISGSAVVARVERHASDPPRLRRELAAFVREMKAATLRAAAT